MKELVNERLLNELLQLFWEKRLRGLSASDVGHEILKAMELPRGLQALGPVPDDVTLLSAVASALHISSIPKGKKSPKMGQNPPKLGINPQSGEKSLQKWGKIPKVGEKMPPLPFAPCRKQEERVRRVRKKLEEALLAGDPAGSRGQDE
ncbi:methyl-CpG-binding domain protein 2-like [Phasianus colchicus]|uniref:methyl-CpG-binding domain protein 2-like n=1 Tax=Phasianus colchicus TaxID=9054 RepID=UPI00129DA00A|nr:methyl-CpG-binding domain protein 2-like [Phasianus colchicus]